MQSEINTLSSTILKSLLKSELCDQPPFSKFYENVNGQDNIIFQNIEVCTDIDVDEEYTYEKNIFFINCIFRETFRIRRGNFQKDFTIKGGNFNELNFAGGFFKSLNFTGRENLSIRHLLFTDVKLDALTIRGFSLRYKINHIGFVNLTIRKDILIRIARIKVTFITFAFTHNFGQLVFDTIHPIDPSFAKLKISNSDLGRLNILNSDFSFYSLDVSGSRISDIFMASSSFLPRKIVTKDLYTNRPRWLDRRMGYRQLKKVMENNGDMIEAMQYHAREMLSFLFQLFPKEISLKELKRMFFNIPDIINLSLNFLTNNFGKSWVQALIITVILVLLSLQFFFSSLGEPFLFQGRFDRIHYFWDYISPTIHMEYWTNEFKRNPSAQYSLSSKTFFYGGKYVVLPYSVYQLIQAFRKYGRKSR